MLRPIIGDSRREQKHLLGAYLFSTRDPIDMGVSGLAQAGAWNYLREEITVALECQRPTRIGIDFDFDAARYYSDSMYSNIITYILARIINHCFGVRNESYVHGQRQRDWNDLRKQLTIWREHLPTSFEPYSRALKQGNPFPSLWLLRPWHGKNLNSLMCSYKSANINNSSRAAILLNCRNLVGLV